MKLHIPVLLNEVIEGLNLKSNYNVIDATLGGGGHSEKILEKTGPNGKIVGFDLDGEAVKLAKKRLERFEKRVVYINDNYKNLEKYESNFDFEVHGILLDLGLSMYQLQDKNRGFSFLDSSGLKMKYDEDSDGVDAQYIVNNFKEEDLEKIFREFGEEKLSKQIAREIVGYRKTNQIVVATELSEIISKVYKRFYRKHSTTNPATKVFQALRIYVNKELENIEKFLPIAIDILEKGGRLAVISYHSLEDRIVKNYFRKESRDCICPVEIPECRCSHKAKIKIINKDIILPKEEEIKDNPASSSAKLRIVEKI